MKILLDFDSVTADLDRHQRDSCNARFGTDYQHEDITSWDWWRWNCPIAHSDYVWGDECFLSRTWTLSIPPVAGAIEGITELLSEGHTIALVSDRAPHMAEWLASWLQQYGLAIPVYTTNREPGTTKIDVARRLGLEAAIEDAPHHASEMAAQGLRVLLLDKPWNRNVPPHPAISRCLGWEQAIHTIRAHGNYWLTTKEMAFKD